MGSLLRTHTHTHTLSYYFSPYTKPSEQSLKPAEEMGSVLRQTHMFSPNELVPNRGIWVGAICWEVNRLVWSRV